MARRIWMAPTSAALLLPVAAAAALMAVALQALQLSAAAAPPMAPPMIGQPGCNTTCGDVSVPYPFGFGPSNCSWPGLNLTCDTRHDPPRLLLGDGTLRVTEISLRNETVRVMRAGSIINASAGGGLTPDGGWNASFGCGFTEHGYWLSNRNELVLSGCNVQATVLADIGEKTPRFVGGCAAFCTVRDDGAGGVVVGRAFDGTSTASVSKPCVDNSGCCRAPITTTSTPSGAQARWLYSGDHAVEQKNAPVNVFIAEEGWIDDYRMLGSFGVDEAPIVLAWRLTQRLPQRVDDVRRLLCRSENSDFPPTSDDLPGFTCQCINGFEGNPYLPGGCQDIDECKLPSEKNGCFGDCINTIGSMDCRCPRGTYGNPGVKGGCVKINSTTTASEEDDVPIGLQPNCRTTCGDVRVPYPFGIDPGCYLPGFKLICNTSHDPPRLFLDGNGTLEVVDISLPDSTVRVIHHTSTFNSELIGTFAPANDNIAVYSDLLNIGEPYMLSTRNEIILSGCDINATLYGEYRNGSSNTSDAIISSCVSTCRSSLVTGDRGAGQKTHTQTHSGHCSGHDDGCCHAPFSASSTPSRMWMQMRNPNISLHTWPFALISEKGLIDQWHMILNKTDMSRLHHMAYPLVLKWTVKQDFSVKSKHSDCRQEDGGFVCFCSTGYHGNPYVAHGCQEINKCSITALGNPCLGNCIKSPSGRFECRCQQGTHGNPFVPGGCVNSHTGLIIGLSVASGPVLLLLVLFTMLVRRKIKHHRVKVLKQKYFKQNRGQLLQQLLSQKADIAERMIIPVDELAKATNNFDKARELGDGGHGTVYKGILSDLHVVAIKKSKITFQREIDEFINEVAILSQINHKNVVKLFGCCLETEVPLLVYEFISNGTLYHHLHGEGPSSLSWDNRLRIATEIASSLAYLHSSVSNPIIHRDIKSSNILLDDTLTAKVSDFGASRYIPMNKTGLTTRIQGTRGYMDPLCFYTGRLTQKSDVFSFGVILIELLTRKKPFSYLSTEGDGLFAHFVNLHAEGNLMQIIDPQVMEEVQEDIQELATLAASCVNYRGEERPTMRQVEHTLEGLRASKKCKKDERGKAQFDNVEWPRFEESSRIYSLEQEMMMSARYPR